MYVSFFFFFLGRDCNSRHNGWLTYGQPLKGCRVHGVILFHIRTILPPHPLASSAETHTEQNNLEKCGSAWKVKSRMNRCRMNDMRWVANPDPE